MHQLFDPVLDRTNPVLDRTNPVLDRTNPVLDRTNPVLDRTKETHPKKLTGTLTPESVTSHKLSV